MAIAQPTYPVTTAALVSHIGGYVDAQVTAASSGGSILFGQADGSLTTSLPWRAPEPTDFVTATVTVTEAVTGATDLIAVKVNGATVQTLSLADGQTASTVTVDIGMGEGDLLTVTRLTAEGGACQVQLDRGA